MYLTAHWQGEVDGEHFALKNYGAQDVRAYDVVKDLERVERFIASRRNWNGLVLVLTNDHSYWTKPKHARDTNAQAFRVYDGNVLHGARAWGVRTGAGTKAGRDAQLTLLSRPSAEPHSFAAMSSSRYASFELPCTAEIIGPILMR